jgi:hypothetical protein
MVSIKNPLLLSLTLTLSKKEADHGHGQPLLRIIGAPSHPTALDDTWLLFKLPPLEVLPQDMYTRHQMVFINNSSLSSLILLLLRRQFMDTDFLASSSLGLHNIR